MLTVVPKETSNDIFTKIITVVSEVRKRNVHDVQAFTLTSENQAQWITISNTWLKE